MGRPDYQMGYWVDMNDPYITLRQPLYRNLVVVAQTTVQQKSAL